MNIYEQILAGLRTKFPGADDATLQRIASKKSEGVTDEGKVNSIVEGISFADVMNNYGDYRADGASKTAKKNAIADYEQQHHLKDGKPIGEPKPQQEPAPKPAPAPEPKPEPAPAPAPQGLAAEDIAKLVAAGVAEAMKPLNERLDKMDADKAEAAFAERVHATAKTFGIPSFAYEVSVIPKDADLNQYFTDRKQAMQNEGYQFAPAPQAGGAPPEGNEGEVIAGLINEGTKELTEKK